MKKLAKFLGLTSMCFAIIFSAVACGEKVPEGSTEIKFWYNATISENKIIKDMVNTYNNGQGKTDKVYVTTDNRKNIDKTSLYVDAPNVLSVDDTNFKSWAIENLFYNLNDFYANSAGNYTEEGIPNALTERYHFDTQKTNNKYMAGEGADLLGLPFGSDGMMHYYSKLAFQSEKINIISVTEENLDGTGKYAKVKPHGYAEYKESPFEGAISSLNLAGETVYKVYNNKIAVNWEEQRYLSKLFTKEYNTNSPTTYGYNSEWWFQYGWSIGGDCIGYNGENYEFTLADKSVNYLVTVADGVIINDNKYSSGEIIRYEDKIKQTNIASMDGLYALPSQYDAIMEFIQLTVPSNKQVQSNVYGYGVGWAESSTKTKKFQEGDIAIMANDSSAMQALNISFNGNYDLAPTVQYREYEGGSSYYNGGDGIANEYLKVIGDNYDGVTYTGEIKEVGDTQIVGKKANFSGGNALVIPTRSDSSKYEAAWKFITWAASEEGQRLYCKTGITPNQTSISYSEDYLSVYSDLNAWAMANAAENGDIGDWAYFENGKWVTDWAGYFNNQVRFGYMTLNDFLALKKQIADDTIGVVNIVIEGRM